MTTNQAVTFAIETIRTAKQSMINNGISGESVIFATCKKLAVTLNLEFSTVVAIMEIA